MKRNFINKRIIVATTIWEDELIIDKSLVNLKLIFFKAETTLMKNGYLYKYIVVLLSVVFLSELICSCTKLECPTLIDSSAFIRITIPSYRITNVQVQSLPDYTDSTSLSVLALTESIEIRPDTIIYTNDISRTYFKFDFSDVPTGVTIGKATLTLFTDDTAESLKEVVSIGQPIDLEPRTMIMKRISSSWSAATLSWNNQPVLDASNPTNILFTGSDSCSINITDIAQYQYSNSTQNYGVVLQLALENANNGQAFYSVKGPASLRPKLIVEYY